MEEISDLQSNLHEKKIDSLKGSIDGKSSQARNVVFLVLILLVVIFISSTVYFAYQNQLLEMQVAQKTKKNLTGSGFSKDKGEAEWITVNSRVSGDEKRFDYMSFKIDYPSYYVVTTGEMLSSYITQGGSAPPSLIFSDRHARVSEGKYREIFRNLDTYIFVANTTGWQTFEEWAGDGWFDTPTKNQVLSKTTEKINSYEVTKRVIINPHNNKKAMDALITEPENVGYYFQTSDEETAKDLERMLKTFDTRGNYYYIRNPSSSD